MRKRFITKRKNRLFNYKFLFLIIFYIFGLLIGYNYLNNSKKNIDNQELVKLLLNNSNHHNKSNIIDKLVSSFNIHNSIMLVSSNYTKLVSVDNTIKSNKPDIKKDPIVYIYNTHQTEEYLPSNYAEYSVKPTVQMVNYILEDAFNKNNISTIVEENRIKDILNTNKWNYSYSYKASRILLENAKSNNNSLKYFIDVHRDSLSKDKTTIKINNKNYASILFIVGLENKNYKNNLEFTTKINDVINRKYPSLSKGIYKKEGIGVNGIYNQDFSPYTILVEIGGKDNNVEEVLNTSMVFAECYMEVLLNNEG